jgi:cyanophycin synthetase
MTISAALDLRAMASAPRIVDSRRLMGPNLFSPREGAVLELTLDDDERAPLLLEWRMLVRLLAEHLGWPGAELLIREHPGGAQCFLAAPIDALLTATEVNEQAWHAAEAIVARGTHPDVTDLAARLRVHRQHEASPRLVALQHAAHRHALTFTFDDDDVSIGAGEGSRTWARSALPDLDDVPWSSLHDIPVALVTGSNGKTTTTRVLVAMMREAGLVTGHSSTDGVWVEGRCEAEGDYSGPLGTRLVLRDRRVQGAALETARGALLRRGLATTRARAAIVTRVAADHMGEYGVHDLRTLGQVKLLVARAVVPEGRLVLNADDETLVALAPTLHPAPAITWCSLRDDHPLVVRHVAAGGDACVVRGGQVVALGARGEIPLGAVADMPLSLGGAASYNTANLQAAAAGALALGVSATAVRSVLARFGRHPGDNPGRLALYALRGARVVVDFVHNADGWDALWRALMPERWTRRLVVVGQAGDRDDEALEALARAVWHGAPTRVFVKEMPKYHRGRPPYEVRERLASAFLALGLAPGDLVRTDSEDEAVRLALAQAAHGDLVMLAVHDDLATAERALQQAGATPAHIDAP